MIGGGYSVNTKKLERCTRIIVNFNGWNFYIHKYGLSNEDLTINKLTKILHEATVNRFDDRRKLAGIKETDSSNYTLTFVDSNQKVFEATCYVVSLYTIRQTDTKE